MIWLPFETEVPAKWVLTGEHSVLYGATAVALPHPDLRMALHFSPDEEGVLRIEPAGAQSVIRDLLTSIPGLPTLSGSLLIESTIPVGAGLGSSAALCVALTQWLAGPLGIARSECAAFATRLEDRFHGQSSGMDVAVISAETPIAYVRTDGARPLGITHLPHFTFHDTGLRARTSDCVSKVEKFRMEHPYEASRADERMSAASLEAIDGLRLYDKGDAEGGLTRIAHAMNAAQQCFEQWELVPDEASLVLKTVLHQGARAAKLTGAGGGGMVVALWH
jgi:mevalonate kinase